MGIRPLSLSCKSMSYNESVRSLWSHVWHLETPIVICDDLTQNDTSQALLFLIMQWATMWFSKPSAQEDMPGHRTALFLKTCLAMVNTFLSDFDSLCASVCLYTSVLLSSVNTIPPPIALNAIHHGINCRFAFSFIWHKWSIKKKTTSYAYKQVQTYTICFCLSLCEDESFIWQLWHQTAGHVMMQMLLN